MNGVKSMAGLTAILCSISLMTAGAMGVHAAEPAAGELPDRIVNGDFEYLSDDLLAYATDTGNFANVDPATGDVNSTAGADGWHHVDGFDAAAFGWKSSQTDATVNGRAGIVEIQRSRDASNTYAEITASQAGTYIYQDIDTLHPTESIYTVSLRHASRNVDHTDSMQVLIGPPGRERPVELTRTASDTDDPVGQVSTTVESTAWGWAGQWDTYEATVTIPAGQPVTRFMFRSVNGVSDVAGNLVDDISFRIGYPLTYGLNGGTGTVPNAQREENQ